MDEEGQDVRPNNIAYDRRWRSRFQCILNQIRTCRALDPTDKKGTQSQIFCNKILRAISTPGETNSASQTANEPDPRWDGITEEQFEAAEKYFEEYIEHVRQGNSSIRDGPNAETCQTCAGQLEYQYRFMRSDNQLQGSSSARRFLYIFERVRRYSDRTLLERPPRRRTQPQNEDPRVRTVIHLRSLKPELIPLFVGSNGHNIRRYLRGKKKVKLEMKTEGSDVQAVLECKDQDRQAITEVLEREAELLVERRRIHERNVQEYNAQQGMDTEEQGEEEQAMDN